MTTVKISKAAEMAGVDRTTLYRKNKKGEISFIEEDSETVIDVSELLRVYPKATVKEESAPQAQQLQIPQVQQRTTSVQQQLLQQENDFLKEKIEEQKKQLCKSEEREDKAQKQIEKLTETVTRQTYLLEHHQEQATKPPEKPVEAENTVSAGETTPKGINGYLVAFAVFLMLVLVGVFALLSQRGQINISSFLPSLVS